MLAPLPTTNGRLDNLEREVSRFVHSISTPFPNDDAAMHSTIAAMHALCVELSFISEGEREGDVVKKILLPAVRLHEHSPFVHRLRNWPRGYIPGEDPVFRHYSFALCRPA